MPAVVAYAIPLNPEPWAMGDAYPQRVGGGKLIAKVSPNKTLQAYQNALKDELTLLGARVLPGDYALRISFARHLYSYTRMEDGGTSTRNRVDATNVQKGTEDALQGVLIGNDRDVLRVETVCIEQAKDVNPFILIELKYHIGENDSTVWESMMSPEGIAALDKMESIKAERIERKANDNVWRP